jgi:RNA polymerase sigma factor (sigma-70 family)
MEDTVVSLVAAAAAGDQDAWNGIVERYSPLLAGVLTGYRLPPAARQDVVQIVWLRLVENLGRIRSAQALPKWLVTTARREALHQLTQQSRARTMDPLSLAWTAAEPVGRATGEDDAVDARLLERERHLALLAALAELPDHQRRLVTLLIAEPPLSYAEISRRLDIPVGYIGPTRQRALDRLRRSEALRGLSDHSSETVRRGA